MANTYTQIYLHIVFAVRGRQCLIPRQHKEELYKYTTGIVKKRGQKLIAIGGMPDHVHVFVGMTPNPLENRPPLTGLDDHPGTRVLQIVPLLTERVC
jgi:REP element-mobilizing transposase RayT